MPNMLSVTVSAPNHKEREEGTLQNGHHVFLGKIVHLFLLKEK